MAFSTLLAQTLLAQMGFNPTPSQWPTLQPPDMFGQQPVGSSLFDALRSFDAPQQQPLFPMPFTMGAPMEQPWVPQTPQVDPINQALPQPPQMPKLQQTGQMDPFIAGPSKKSQPYEAFIEEAARTYPNVPAHIIRAVIRAESDFNPNDRSPAGAIGLMQLMPGTARDLGVSNPWDPRQNIMGGTKYLSQMYDMFGSWDLAFAAYNAGPGNVRKAGRQVPRIPETQDYVAKLRRWIGL